jgi:Protein of unknown function (DUF1091)
MKASGIFCLFLVTVFASQALGKVIITRADVEANHDYATASINVKNKTDGTFVDISLDVNKQIDGKIQVSIEVLKRINGAYHSLLMTTVRNVCDVLAIKKDIPAIDMVIQLLSQFGTIPTDCPINKGHVGIKDFQIPDFLISPMVTGGDYQLILKAEDHNVAPPVHALTTIIEVTMIKDANSNPDKLKNLLKLLSN